jgi:hypothetical protein
MIWEELIRLLGTAAVAAIVVSTVQALSTRKKLGSEAHRADAEAEATSVETARGLVAELRIEATKYRLDVELLTKRVAELEHERATDRTKISSLERQVSAVINDRDAVVDWVTHWRGWFLAGAKPPPPPVPMHLRDVLPEWAADDHDRTTDTVVPTNEEN